tara:strand:+ start:695 stop:1168 length:474 start_codon:yes stop_codon:yes gene_type:complete
MTQTITVALDEEYGYREWIWETGMTAAELEAWWSAKQSLGAYFFSPVGLPGSMMQVAEDMTEVDAKCMALLERGPDGKGELTKEECDAQIARTLREHPYKLVYTETGEEAPKKESGWWSAHIHMDEDSHLCTSGGRYIHHAGYAKACVEAEANYPEE